MWKTIPMPEGATVGRNGIVTWAVRGKKKRTGKLSSSPGKVSVQSDTWTAQFTDEHGKCQRISTKTTVRSVAEKMLARYQTEVDRIRTGVATREELSKAHLRLITLDKALEQFRTKMIADGSMPGYISSTMRQITLIFRATGIDTLTDIRRETIEPWIANEVQQKVHSPSTINHYLKAVKAFVQYLVDIEILSSHPLKAIRSLNEALDQRKKRRAMTADEIERLFHSVATRKSRAKRSAEERILIYRLLIGTGLRSTELSLLTPSQIDFEHCRLRVEAAKTKNKKSDVLPIRSDLVQSVKKWVEDNGIQSHERIFHYDSDAIRRTFYYDLKAAGIERASADGRSIDVHSLRKTFGTILAMAWVPLTTVQRLMRHSTPMLTAKLYIDVDPTNMMQAVEQMPAFGTVIPTSPKPSPNDSL